MSKKILIVDDEPDIVFLLKSRFESNGFNAIGASNGKEGLEKAISEKPDLIVLDLLMPEKDGYETMNELKNNDETKDIPVILFTAASPEKVVEKGDETVEAIDFVIKPFDDGALETLLLKAKQLTGIE